MHNLIILQMLMVVMSTSLPLSLEACSFGGRDPVLELVVIGDSLSDGYLAFNENRHPYTLSLSSYAENDGWRVQIHNFAVSGAEIRKNAGIYRNATQNYYNETMQKIINTKFLRKTKNVKKVAVIYGGINDLTWGKNQKEVAESILDYKAALQVMGFESYVVLNTNSKQELKGSHNFNPDDQLFLRRTALNNYFRWNMDSDHLIDTNEFINYLDPDHKEVLFDVDGFHFSKKGYDLLGKIIFLKIFKK